MDWAPQIEERFKELIAKLPVFHRTIAESVVREKAQALAKTRGSERVEKEDLTEAFLSEVPEVFKNYLVELLKETGLE